MIDSLIAYQGATYIRDLTVYDFHSSILVILPKALLIDDSRLAINMFSPGACAFFLQ